MKIRYTISFLFILNLIACTKEVTLPEDEPIPKFVESCQRDGNYLGIMVSERKNSINGIEYGSKDTFQLEFSIACQVFTHGNCEGTVAIVSDTISFESGSCNCWCDCSPYTDCGGDPLLGSRLFSFDGDSLMMWAEGGGIDSLSIPGQYFGHWFKVEYLLKKQ